jgi:hypothetical protein
MSEPVVTDGLIDHETALEREADLIAERFPGVAHDDVERRLHEGFDELAGSATIHAHLVTVAGSAVTNELIADGEEFRTPTADI